MAKKPRLSFAQIWNMSFGFLGIQFGFALQNANVSRIFESLGASVEDIPILWIAAPVTGLIVQPIIGYMSDRTWGKLGRRRPFFLIGAILASIALIFMPNSPTLWIAAGMLWIMDASINISMEPFRAFVGDNLPSEQRTKGFAMQSFFIGIGAVIASLLPYVFANWLGMSNEAGEGAIPDTVKWSFYIGGLVFFLAVLYTIITSKEYSPEELASFDEGNEESYHKAEMGPEEHLALGKRQVMIGSVAMLIGILLSVLFNSQGYDQELYILSFGIGIFGLLMGIAGTLQKGGSYSNSFVNMINDIQQMPQTMKQLAPVQFFSWFALFAMWIYTTSGITSTKYDMKLNASELSALQSGISTLDQSNPLFGNGNEIITELSDYNNELEAGQKEATASMKVVRYFLDDERATSMGLDAGISGVLSNIDKQYNDGANWVGVCFAVYNGFAAIFAFLLMAMANITSRKMTHMICLVIGGLSLISIFFISDPNMILVSFIGVGLVWASILAMPYAILTGALPSDKMGYYMGVFNFFIVIPQIVAASILGFLIGKLFGGEAIYALIIGGVSMIIAGILTLLVDDVDEGK